MVRSAAIAGSIVLFAATAGVTHAASAATVPTPTRWQFAPDFRSHPGHNPFTSYQGGPAVWSVRQSQSLTRNGNYSLLRSFSSTFGAAGLRAWHGNSLNCVHVPAIGVNTSDAPARLCRGQVPGKAAFARPSGSRMAVVAWTSPFTGTVKISHDAIADVDGACGDGISYFVALGTRPLQSIHLKNKDATTLPNTTQTIRAGQSLYFIVDSGPKRNASCDTTQLQLTIDRV
jgi:hypothetical protein